MAAEACYQTRKYPNRAFLTRVHFDEGEVKVFPIHYIDQPQEGWSADSGLFLHAPQNEGVFSVEWKSMSKGK